MSGERVRRFHAASWDEPLVMQMGEPGRRGMFFPPIERWSMKSARSRT